MSAQINPKSTLLETNQKKEEQSQFFTDLSQFEGLMLTAKKAIHQQKFDQLNIINTLARGLLKQSFQHNSPEVFAKVIRLAVEFGQYAYEVGAAEVMAHMFKLYAVKIPLIRAAFQTKNLGLFILWIVQGYFHSNDDNNKTIMKGEKLEQNESNSPKIDPTTILAFKQKVLSLLNVKLRNVKALFVDVDQALQKDDLQLLTYYAYEASALLQDSFERNQPKDFAAIIDYALHQVISSHDKRRWDYVISALKLDGKELAHYETMVQMGETPLLAWHLVDNVEVGDYASMMAITPYQIAQFKETVFKNLKKISQDSHFLRSPAQIMTRAMQVYDKTQQESEISMLANSNTLSLCARESQAVISSTFSKLDSKGFSEMILALGEWVQKAYQSHRLELLPAFLKLDEDDLESLMLLVESKEPGLVHRFIIETFQLENIAKKYHVSIPEIQKFKADGVALLAEKLKLPTLIPTIKEFHARTHLILRRSEISPKGVILQRKLANALIQHTFQQGDVATISLIMTTLVDIAQTAQRNGKIFELLTAFDYPLIVRDALMQAISANDSTKVLLIIVAMELFNHKNTCYGFIGEISDFKTKVCKELGIDSSLVDKISRDALFHRSMISMNDDRLISAEDPNILKLLDDLLNQIKSSAQKKEFETIDNIKKIVVSLCKQSFVLNKPAIMAKIIQNCLEFSRFCQRLNLPDVVASVFGIFATDIGLVKRALERRDYHLLAWWLIDDLDLDYAVYSNPNTRTLKDIQPFKEAVYQLFAENAKLRLPTPILEDIRKSYTNHDQFSINYHVFEAHASLKQAFVNNDAIAFSAFIEAAIKLATKASEEGNFLFLMRVFELEPQEVIHFSKQLKDKQLDAITWQLVDGLRLFRHVRFMPISMEDCTLFKKAVYYTLCGKEVLSLEPEAIEKAIREKMSHFSKHGILNKISLDSEIEEADRLLKDCFLSNEHKSFFDTLQRIVMLSKDLLKIGQISLLTQVFDIDSDKLEKLILLLNSENADDQALLIYLLVDYLALKKIAAVQGLEMDFTNQFILLVFEHGAKLFKRNTLLPVPRDVKNRSIAAMSKKPMHRLELFASREHFIAAISYSYENQNPKLMVEVLNESAEVLMTAHQKGYTFELLEMCQYDLSKRDKLFVHLQMKDKDSLIETLVELECEAQETSFSNIYSYAPARHMEFKMALYNILGRVPPEVSIKGFYQLQEFSSNTKILDWLINIKKPFKLDDPVVQKYLALLAKMPYISTLYSYLESFKEEPYPTILAVVKDLNLKYRLAHRFGLGGKSKTAGVEIDLEASLIEAWLPEIQSQHTLFLEPHYEDGFKTIAKPLSNILGRVQEDKLKDLCQSIHSDIQATSLHTTVEKLIERYQQGNVVHMPVLLKGIKDHHYVLLSLMEDLCLIADNGRHHDAGIHIFSLNDKKLASEILPSLLQKLILSHQRNDKMPKIDEFQNSLIKSLGLTPIGIIPYREQKVGNCGYASCAKMIVRSSCTLRVYQFLTQSLGEKDLKKALNTAIRATKIYGKMFAAFDRVNFLREYFYTYRCHEETRMKWMNANVATTNNGTVHKEIANKAIDAPAKKPNQTLQSNVSRLSLIFEKSGPIKVRKPSLNLSQPNLAQSTNEVKRVAENQKTSVNNTTVAANATKVGIISAKGLEIHPDPILLSQVYLKSEHRAWRTEVLKTLELNGFKFDRNSTEAKAAYEGFLIQMKELIKLSKIEVGDRVQEVASSLLEIYLQNRRSQDVNNTPIVQFSINRGGDRTAPANKVSISSAKPNDKPQKTTVESIYEHQSECLEDLFKQFLKGK